MAAMARQAWLALPTAFRERAAEIEFRFEDFPSDELLADLEIEDPFALTGLYEGPDLTERSLLDPTPAPAKVFLFRRPILEEWIERGDVTLEDLVAHVLIHEVAHHFGISDEAIDQLLDEAED